MTDNGWCEECFDWECHCAQRVTVTSLRVRLFEVALGKDGVPIEPYIQIAAQSAEAAAFKAKNANEHVDLFFVRLEGTDDWQAYEVELLEEYDDA